MHLFELVTGLALLQRWGASSARGGTVQAAL
jgi:hypothetical protein